MLYNLVPSAPEDVKAVVVSADSIKLSWRPPAWRNGDILSYSIFTQVDRVRDQGLHR